MKHRISLFVVLLALTCQSAFADWLPNEKYACFVRTCKLDKAWKFTTPFQNYSNGGAGCGNVDDGVQMTDFPGVLSLSFVVLHRRTYSAAQHMLDYIDIYIRNTSNYEEYCVASYAYDCGGEGENPVKFLKQYIVDRNCHPYYIGTRYYGRWGDGEELAYVSVVLDDNVRNWIAASGDNLQIRVAARWDGATGATLHNYTDYARDGKWDMSDHQQLNAAAPTLSGLGYSVSGNTSRANFTIHQNEMDVTTLRWYCNGYSQKTIGASSSTNTMDLPGLSADVLSPTSSGNRYEIEVYAQKTYQVDRQNYALPTYKATSFGTLNDAGYNWLDSKTIYKSSRYTMPSCQMPQNFKAVDQGDGSIKVSWDIPGRQNGRDYDESSWVLERSLNSNFSNSTQLEERSYNRTETNHSYTDHILEYGQGKVRYYYRVRRKNFSFNNPSINTSCDVQTDYAQITSSHITTHPSTGTLSVQWTISSGVWTDKMRLHLLYGTSDQQFDKTTTSAEVTGVTPCVPQTVTLRVMNDRTPLGDDRTDTVVMPNETPSRISKLSVSKGFYSGRVEVNWTIPSDASNFTHFKLLRRGIEEKEYVELSNINCSTGQLLYHLTDATPVPGEYYQYRVEGYTACNDDPHVVAAEEAVGFAQPYGVITGQIVYSGNQAVEGVTVTAEGGSDSRCNRSAFFPENGTGRILVANDGSPLLSATRGTTVEMWVRSIDSTHFVHYAQVWNADTCLYYKNGEACSAAEVYLPFAESGDTLCIGQDAQGKSFAGWLDDIRIWGVCRTPKQIADYYNAYLNGGESGLLAYYRCDDPIDGELVDVSHTKTSYNERHAQTHNLTIDADPHHVPTTEQLSLKAITDTAGTYIITGVPFTENGCLYNVRPTLGVHAFSPSVKPLYMNGSASTHNNVDFTDQSSFVVKGSVFYEGTSIPVSGCTFKIDGTICSKDGEMVQSDDQGEFTLSVPIGQHFITIEKTGHTFTYSGRYPAEAGTTHLFDQAMTGLSFTDNTKVLLLGRVCGGQIQAAKPHGFSQSKNNIGVGKIELQLLTESQSLNYKGTTERQWSSPDSLNCHSHATTPVHGATAGHITILTDSTTGEFAALVPPVDLQVTRVTVPSNPDFSFPASCIKTLGLSNCVQKTLKDSCHIDGETRYQQYNCCFDAVGQADPVLDILQTGSHALGDRHFLCTTPDGSSREKINWTEQNDTVTYTLGYPLFTSANTYVWDIALYDLYYNYDNPSEVQLDSVPWRMGRLDIRGDVPATAQTTLQLDANGRGSWRWQAGSANIASPYTLGMQITMADSAGTTILPWTENDRFRAYIRGSKPEPGSDFVTMGPNKLLYILRCPPGKSSTAKFSQGSTISYNTTSEKHYKGSENFTTVSSFGLEGAQGLGTGLMVISKYKAEDELTVAAGSDQSYTWNETMSSSTTTARDLSISRNAKMTGAEADVYYGNSTNRIFGVTQMLTIVYDSTATTPYSFTTKRAISMRDTINTTFAYSQYDIVHREIPQFDALRKQLKVEHVSDYNNLPVNNSMSYKYYSTRPADDPARYETGNYQAVAPTYRSVSVLQVRDSLEMYNNAIDGWKAAIRSNEEAKLKAIAAGTTPYDSAAFRTAQTAYQFYQLLREREWTGDILDISHEEYGLYRDVVQTTKKNSEGNYYDRIILPWNIKTFFETYHLIDKKIVTEKVSFLSTEYTLGEAHLTDFYTGGWFRENYSVSGGAQLSESLSTAHTGGESNTFSYTISATVSNKWGMSICGVGEVWSLGTTQGGGSGYTDGSSSTQTNAVSFTMDANPYETYTVDVYNAPDGFGPIFYTRGGETYCPYEAPDSTLYALDANGKRQPLQGGTIRLEQPQILINQQHAYTISDVPAGETTTAQAVLSNLASSVNNSMKMSFQLSVIPATNPNGLEIGVDGYTLGLEGQAVKLGCPATLQKTLSFRQTDLSVNDYDSIGIMLRSDCETSINDIVYVSVHFVPQCTPLTVSTESNIINTLTSDTIEMTIEGYDRNYHGLTGIRIERRAQGQTTWQTDSVIPISRIRSGVIRYPLSLHGRDDGTYEVRAVSTCQTATYSKDNESNILTLTKDMQVPTLLGSPEPSNAHYTLDTDLALNWSEDINTGLLTKANFSFTGDLGQANTDHAVALDLSHPLITEASYTLPGTDFSGGMWLKWTKGGQLMRFGEDAFVVALDDAGHLIITANGTSYRSTNTMDKDQWSYLHVNVGGSGEQALLTATAFTDSKTVTLFKDQVITPVTVISALSLGDTTLRAAIHSLVLWAVNRTPALAQSEMYQAPYMYSAGLTGYWPMNEGHGTVAEDPARSRHIKVPESSWYLGGTNYAAKLPAKGLSIDITRANLTPDDEYVLEFWFRGQQSDSLFAIVGDTTRTFGMMGYGDGVWHHMAMSYVRHGYASFYIDGTLQKTLPQTAVAGMVGSELRLYAQEVDEVRLWRGRVSSGVIADRRYQRVRDTESGLSWRFAFERDTLDSGNQTTTVYTTRPAKGDVALREATALQVASSCPPLSKARQMQSIDFSFRSSSTRTVFSLDATLIDRIEDATVTAQAELIPDMNGNRSDVITWQFLVDRSQLQWSDPNPSHTCPQYASSVFTLDITNSSGLSDNWQITGVPSWLTLSETSGSIAGMQTLTLTAVTSEALQAGYYAATLYLTNDQGIRVPLDIMLHVTTDEPQWTVNESQYQYTMNMVCQVKLPTGYPTSEDNLVAAFVGDECVGVAHPKYFTNYGTCFVMLNVLGNTSTIGQPLEFRVWASTSGRIFSPVQAKVDGQPQTILFRDGQIVGSITSPVLLYADGSVQQVQDFEQGWNWISYYIDPSSDRFNDILQPVAKSVIQLNNATGFSLYSTKGDSLMGTVRTMRPEEMYKLRVSSPVELLTDGQICQPAQHPITLHGGWNWIGFVSSTTMTVREALSGISPKVGDAIKSRKAFAMWDGADWVGSLTYLQPGEGYMYRSQAAANEHMTLVYPTFNLYQSGAMLAPQRRMAADTAHYALDVNGAYPTTMSMVVSIVRNGQKVEGAELAAYVGTECRGVADTDADLWFVSLEGQSGDEVQLHIWDPATQQETITETAWSYLPDGIYGSVENPVVIDLDHPSALDEVETTQGVRYVLRDQVLYIVRDGLWYTTTGQQVATPEE